MLSGTSTDSRKLSCSRATALEQEKTSSQSLCQKAYFPAYDSNSYSFSCISSLKAGIFHFWFGIPGFIPCIFIKYICGILSSEFISFSEVFTLVALLESTLVSWSTGHCLLLLPDRLFADLWRWFVALLVDCSIAVVLVLGTPVVGIACVAEAAVWDRSALLFSLLSGNICKSSNTVFLDLATPLIRRFTKCFQSIPGTQKHR